jgi:hypothetical protein
MCEDIDAFIEPIVEAAQIPSRRRRGELRRELRSHFEDSGLTPEALHDAVARFGNTTPIDRAQAELSAVAGRLEASYPEANRGRGVRLYPLWQTPFNNAGAMLPTLGIALAVVIAVLLIACANVGSLLLVRALARQREMTVRVSIGAGRLRLVRQLMTEGIILSGIGGNRRLIRGALAPGRDRAVNPPRGGVLLRLPGVLDWRVFALSGGVYRRDDAVRAGSCDYDDAG